MNRVFFLLSLAAALFSGTGLAALPSKAPPREAPSLQRLADVDRDHLSDGLQARLERLPPDAPVDVLVSFSGRGNAASAQRAVGPFRVKREFRIIRGFAATMIAAQARALARVPGIFRVEEDFRVYPVIDASDRDFGTESARGYGLSGSGIGICVIDTGVDPAHEQLDNGKVMAFRDEVNGRAEPYDDNGHGTHVASIAAGDGVGASANAAAFQGVAPEAGVYAVKVLDASGSGYASAVIAGVEWCVAQPARILSMSLGSQAASDGQDALSQAVNNAVGAGKIAVVAAGNSGDGPKGIGSPGAAEQAVTVGAAAEWSAPVGTGRHSDGVYLAPFSSRGPTLDGRQKPDIASPGVTVAAAQAGTTSGYVAYSGTSMATPFVSGALALALQAKGDLTPAALKQALYGTAQDRGPAGPDTDWGAGLLDGYALAASALGQPALPHAFPSNTKISGSVANNGSWEYGFALGSDALNVPIAATVLVEGEPVCLLPFLGSCLLWYWSPDLDARLIDPNGNVIASSDCPGAGDCGAMGHQETLRVMPTVAGNYTVQVFPYSGSPNNGQGGSFLMDLSKGPVGAVANQPPVAAFTANPTSGSAPLDVTFSASGSSDPDGSIAAYQWSFGDGATATGMTASHTYQNPGLYTAVLTVTDNKGASDTEGKMITVLGTSHIGDLDGARRKLRGGKWVASVTATVHDRGHTPVGGATVSFSVAPAGGSTTTASCTTSRKGSCKVSSPATTAPSVSFSVTGIAYTTLVYSPSDNHDPDSDSNGSQITVPKP